MRAFDMGCHIFIKLKHLIRGSLQEKVKLPT